MRCANGEPAWAWFPFSGKEVGTGRGFKFPRSTAAIIKLYADKKGTDAFADELGRKLGLGGRK